MEVTEEFDDAGTYHGLLLEPKGMGDLTAGFFEEFEGGIVAASQCQLRYPLSAETVGETQYGTYMERLPTACTQDVFKRSQGTVAI